MKPNEYQKLAARTECDQKASKKRMHHAAKGLCYDNYEYWREVDLPIRLNHAVVGLAGEVGELASALERWIYYGKDLDRTNIAEELGDCLWYIALACTALRIDMGEIMQANIDKLKVRYPDRYTDAAADLANRDREAERAAMEGRVYDEDEDEDSSL